MSFGPTRAGVRLRLEDPEGLRPGRKASAAFLLVGCLVIVFWQATSFERRAELDRTYGISGSRGLYPELSQRFFYFLYYTGKFPLSVEPPGLQLQYSTEAAHALLDYAGLVNESYAFVRTGDLGKVFLHTEGHSSVTVNLAGESLF
mgnify:CR=1 FL=1